MADIGSSRSFGTSEGHSGPNYNYKTTGLRFETTNVGKIDFPPITMKHQPWRNLGRREAEGPAIDHLERGGHGLSSDLAEFSAP